MCDHICTYACTCMYMLVHKCGNQRTTCENQFSLPAMWDPGFELRSSGLGQSLLAEPPQRPEHNFLNVFKLTWHHFWYPISEKLFAPGLLQQGRGWIQSGTGRLDPVPGSRLHLAFSFCPWRGVQELLLAVRSWAQGPEHAQPAPAQCPWAAPPLLMLCWR